MRIKCCIIRKSLFCGWQLANQNRNRLLRLGSQNILRTFRRLIQSPSKSYLETAAAFQKCRWWALWQMAHANKIQRNRKHSFWCVRLPRHNTTPVVSKCSKLRFDADTDIAERTIMITLKLETWRPAVGREKESRIVSLSLPLPRALLSASALWGEEIVDGDEARGDNLFQCQLELLLNVLAELCVQTWDVFGRFSLSLSLCLSFFFFFLLEQPKGWALTHLLSGPTHNDERNLDFISSSGPKHFQRGGDWCRCFPPKHPCWGWEVIRRQCVTKKPH